MTRRRWIADRWDGTSASVTGEQAAHLVRVLRAQPGMACDMVAGDRVWRAEVAGIRGDTVDFTLLFEIEGEPALPVTLLLSVFKFDRMEWILEKATELGAERFVPMIARRSEKHLVKAAEARVDRWRRIVREAAKQSRRSDVPVVENLLSLKEALRVLGTQPCLRLMLAEQERATSLLAAMQAGLVEGQPDVRLAIGPEGGWTTEEESLFSVEGWQAVTLGPRILRAETAGVSAMAIVAALLDCAGKET